MYLDQAAVELRRRTTDAQSLLAKVHRALDASFDADGKSRVRRLAVHEAVSKALGVSWQNPQLKKLVTTVLKERGVQAFLNRGIAYYRLKAR